MVVGERGARVALLSLHGWEPKDVRQERRPIPYRSPIESNHTLYVYVRKASARASHPLLYKRDPRRRAHFNGLQRAGAGLHFNARVRAFSKDVYKYSDPVARNGGIGRDRRGRYDSGYPYSGAVNGGKRKAEGGRREAGGEKKKGEEYETRAS